ncbi:hypothetical protein M8C21_012945, partial [Ambrosia artemisiifolia]
ALIMELRQVVEAVVPRAVEAAWNSTKALVSMDENHSHFQEKVKTLRAVRDDLKDQTTKFKSTMKRTMDKWFQRVKDVEEHAQKHETCFSAIKNTSAWLHVFSRTKLSREMTSICSVIDTLVMESHQFRDSFVHKVADRVLKMTAPEISYISSQQDLLNQILQCLPDNRFRAIRVLGMSGTGKTTILKNLNNHEMVAQMYERVIFLTVSSEENHKENLSIKMLQKRIAERLIIDMECTENIEIVARKITEALEGVTFLLLLDDVKAEPDLDLIGIPEGARGSKIVMTTKFQHVKLPLCNNIEVKTLSPLDSWNMFHKLLALPNDVKEKPQLERIARKTLEICDGLPLMLKMAASVFKAIEKREYSEISWNDGLQTFKRWPEKKENNMMKNLLKFCCDHLDHEQKPCFLYSALHPEDTEISMEGLMECWAAQNFLKSGDDEKIVGRNILSHLKNVMLLEESEKRHFVRMHKVIRAIALNILSEDMGDGCLVRTSEAVQIPNFPKRQRMDLWTDKKWISLANDSLNISPDAPHSSQLTTLFVQKYSKQKQIPDSFFQHMCNLLVLNFDKTEIMTLPSSIGKLSKLKVLYLNGCKLLMKLPSLIEKLKCLEVLDVRGSGVCNLPHQIKGLPKLRRLLLSFPISTQANYDVIVRLSGLEELIVDVDSEVQECSQLIEDLVKKFSTLPRVITFQLCFLNEVIDVIQVVGDTVKIYMPTEYHLYVKYYNGRGHTDVFNIVLAVKVQAFELINHSDIEYIPKVESMDHVKSCLIESCHNMREIVRGDGTLNRSLLHNMERLDAKNMPKLESIWEGQVPLGSLSKLKTLVLCNCPMLTIVFSSDVVKQLRELQHLEVQDCGMVKEIVTCSRDISPYVFPKLTTLILCRVESLSKIGFTLVWTSLRTLKILDCPTLKEFPFNNNSVMTLENIEIERSWWEALQWPDSEVKEQLESYFFRPLA